MMDYYAILEVAVTATQDEIRASYRIRIALYHPDRHQDTSAETRALAEQKTRELNEAYAVLSDPEKRAAYDKGRRRIECPLHRPPPVDQSKWSKPYPPPPDYKRPDESTLITRCPRCGRPSLGDCLRCK